VREESRKHPRFAVDVAVELRARVGGTLPGRCRNVSRGGLCVLVPDPAKLGAEVVARMALVFDTDAVSDPLELPARIVWCTKLGDEYQLGAAFLPLTARQIDNLDVFIRYVEEGRAHLRAQEPEPESDDPFNS